MSFARKLTTLINATVRGGLPQRQRRARVLPNDPEDQLTAIRKALAEVEAKERAVVERLKSTEAKAEAAVESGDQAEAAAQQKLARELEVHLKTQSTEAIQLSEKLEAIEAQIEETRSETHDRISTADEVLSEDEQSEQPKSSDEELSERKSRLSR